jgi:hypothetical protein
MTPAQVKAAMLADLARSGLDAKDAALLKISCTPHTLNPPAPGYTLTYFDAKGRVIKFYRVRYLEDTRTGFAALSGRKPLRYNQPPKTTCEVYMPPYIKWSEVLGNSAMPLVITEGEKKSAAATKRGIPTLGLGGVWSFMSKRDGEPLVEPLASAAMKGRPIFICYDSDAVGNLDVAIAEATLAKRLTELGAVVNIARLPAGEFGEKIGIDDYLLKHSAAYFKRKVLDAAFVWEECKQLHAMNGELVYIRNLGFIYDYTHSMRISHRAFKEHSHINRWITVKGFDKDGNPKLDKKSAAKLWLEWEHRAELPGITYAPGQPSITEAGELNLWPGWGVADAVKGDVAPWRELLDWLFNGSEPASRLWFERWCAYPIQNPGCKMATAVVFWGPTQGTGKTLCANVLMRLYGKNAAEVKDADLTDTRFTWAENKQFVLGDDITGQNNRKLANMFKTMVTQKTLHVDQKYIPKYTVPDLINYFFTSNDPDAFYLDDGDRRFFIHEVLCQAALSVELRVKVLEWIRSDVGASALFHYLLTLPLGDFDPQASALNTIAKSDMTSLTKSELGAWVARLRSEPDAVLGGKLRGDLFTAEELHLLYDPLGDKRATPNALARELRRSGFHRVCRSGGAGVRIGDRQLRLYAILNSNKWLKASLRDVSNHYCDTHAMDEKVKY